MSKIYNEEIEVPICVEEPKEVPDTKARLSTDAILGIVIAAIAIIFGVLATLAVFMGWETLKMYICAGIGTMYIVVGAILIGMAFCGELD